MHINKMCIFRILKLSATAQSTSTDTAYIHNLQLLLPPPPKHFRPFSRPSGEINRYWLWGASLAAGGCQVLCRSGSGSKHSQSPSTHKHTTRVAGQEVAFWIIQYALVLLCDSEPVNMRIWFPIIFSCKSAHKDMNCHNLNEAQLATYKLQHTPGCTVQDSAAPGQSWSRVILLFPHIIRS